jgi:hypothetical protein
MKRAGILLGLLTTLGAAGAFSTGAGAMPVASPCGSSGILGGSSGQTGSCSYAAGATDTFTVPAGVSQVSITAIGGKGGNGYIDTLNNTVEAFGGFAASVGDSTVSVTSGSSLTVAVGGNGGNGGNGGGGAAGSNGGGAGGTPTGGGGTLGGGGGGGGSSVFSGSTPLVIAGGGGGGGGQGGDGGAAGQDGAGTCPGTAGTSSADGAGGSMACSGAVGGDGSSGQGGTGGTSNKAGGGGGGGGYHGGGGGGGSGSGVGDGGGGGSSFAVDQGASIGTDNTGTPVIKISWTLPTPTLLTTVKDGSAAWSGSETTGAQASDAASFDPNSLVQGETPTGTVYYDFFTNGTCAPQAATHEIESTNGQPPSSGGTEPLPPGSYSYQASYSGDSNYHSATGTCEQFSVAQGAPTVDTMVYNQATGNPWTGKEVTGDRAYDTATVSGASGFTPTGSVVYSLFDNNTCEGVAIATDQKNLSSGTVPKSTSTNALNAGSYSFVAGYSGDDNYQAVAGTCEPFTVAHRAAPHNNVPPHITGTRQDGRILSASPGVWSSRASPSYSYAWTICSPTGTGCRKIVGATHPTLSLTHLDVGHRIGVIVTAIDEDSPSGTATATPVGPVAKPRSPRSTSLPVLRGAPRVGHTLMASGGSWSSPDRIKVQFHWDRCSRADTHCTSISGATHSSYKLTQADLGHKLVVVETATDQEGQTGRAISKPAGPVTR